MKWSSIYVGWSFFTRLIRGLVIPRIMAPAQYGLFASLSVLLNFSQYSDLGMRLSMAKRLPYTLAEKGEDSFRKMAGEGATWVLSTSSLVAFGILVYSFLQHGPNADFYRFALRIVAVTVVLGRAREYLATTLISLEEFRRSLTAYLIYDGVTLVVSIGLLYWIGLMGAVWALLVGELAALAHLLRYLHFRLAWPEFGQIWHSFRESSLLLAISVMDTVLYTIDQIFLLKFYTKEQYGLYSLGLAFCAISLSLTYVFQTSVQPRILGLSGEGRHFDAHRVVDASVTLCLILTLFALALLVPSMPVVVHFYLPKYAAGIPTYVLLAGFSLVRGPAILLRPYYLAGNKERKLLMYQLAAGGAAIVLAALVVFCHGGITAIAISSLVGFSIITGLMLSDFDRTSEVPVSFGKYAIMSIGCASLIGVSLIYSGEPNGVAFWPYLVRAARNSVVSLLLLLVLAFTMRKQLKLAANIFMDEKQVTAKEVDVITETI